VSNIASFYVLDEAGLLELARVASACADTTVGLTPFHQAMVEHAREVDAEYLWSGVCMERLLSFLRWRGVRLRTKPFRVQSRAINRVYGYTVLTARPRPWSLARMDPTRYDEAKLARHIRLRSQGFDEAGMAAMDGLRLLHSALSALGDGEVFMVNIG
jgi:hypothetical protein